jgi:hypothetical protein
MRQRPEKRNNLKLSPRVAPPDDLPPLNTYSSIVVAAWNCAQSMAADCGHPTLGVHHFISGLFRESDASAQLRAMGYTDDNDDVRRHRHGLFGATKATAIELPAEGLDPSDCLKAWFEAAKYVADKREYELQTITVGDFVTAVTPQLAFTSKELSKVQRVVGQYRRDDKDIPFPQKVVLRFDHVDSEAERNRDEILSAIGVVDGHVGAVDARVETVRIDAIKHRDELKDDTTDIRERLPKEMRLARTLMGFALVCAIVAGVPAGFLVRLQFGIL